LAGINRPLDGDGVPRNPALRWKNIDLERGAVQMLERLEHTKAGSLRFKRPKNKTRGISLPIFAVEELRRRTREQAEELSTLGVRQDGNTLVCAPTAGSAMLPTRLTHEFIRITGRVEGVLRVRFHDLRHSHATQFLAAGVHPKIAHGRLGHSSIGVTLDLYTHVTETMQ